MPDRSVAVEGTLDGMPDGAYVVTWYDPQKGRWMESAAGEAHDGRLVVPVPAFRRDLAARIDPAK